MRGAVTGVGIGGASGIAIWTYVRSIHAPMAPGAPRFVVSLWAGLLTLLMFLLVRWVMGRWRTTNLPPEYARKSWHLGVGVGAVLSLFAGVGMARVTDWSLLSLERLAYFITLSP